MQRPNLAGYFGHYRITLDRFRQRLPRCRHIPRQHYLQARRFPVRENANIDTDDLGQLEQFSIMGTKHSVNIAPRWCFVRHGIEATGEQKEANHSADCRQKAKLVCPPHWSVYPQFPASERKPPARVARAGGGMSPKIDSEAYLPTIVAPRKFRTSWIGCAIATPVPLA